MNTGVSARLKRIAKVLAAPCAIEVLLPGGTLIVLGWLLAGRANVPVPAGGPLEAANSAVQRARAAWSARRTR
ncbi:MAG TPA: hypothetical protein VED18_17900 [Candidatus Sulfotelmatobacter sp.]|nr:hypothetical protein [Candidatus Sulfotelmatobacter sp.]